MEEKAQWQWVCDCERPFSHYLKSKKCELLLLLSYLVSFYGISLVQDKLQMAVLCVFTLKKAFLPWGSVSFTVGQNPTQLKPCSVKLLFPPNLLWCKLLCLLCFFRHPSLSPFMHYYLKSSPLLSLFILLSEKCSCLEVSMTFQSFCQRFRSAIVPLQIL